MAAQDDTAYQDNPYGVTDPTQLYQQLQDKTGGNGNVVAASQRGALAGGFNPAMQHANAVQAQLQKILAGEGPAGEDEEPLDHQLRQARAISQGMVSIDPNVSMRADQQMIRLQNAKASMSKLQADTEHVKSETSASQAKEASDPMVWIQADKDGMGLPRYTQVGQGVSMMNPDGSYRSGWSNDMLDELNKNGGMKQGVSQMRQSQFLQLLERTNEGKNIAQMAKIQQQTNLMMMGQLSDQTISDMATSIHDRERPPTEVPTSRDPVSKMNFDKLVRTYDAMYGDGEYGKVDKGDFANNNKTYNEFGPGQSGQRVQNFNVALTHANLLREYATRLKPDGSMPDIPFLNYFRTAWAKQGGGDAPTSFDAMKNFVADEWAQAIISSRNGAALTDREVAQAELTRNASQKQLGGVLDGWQALGGGQLDGLERRFKSSLQGVPQTKVDARWDMKLSPEARAEYTKTEGGRKAPAPSQSARGEGNAPAKRSIVQTGMLNGRPVVKYSTGEVEYAQ